MLALPLALLTQGAVPDALPRLLPSPPALDARGLLLAASGVHGAVYWRIGPLCHVGGVLVPGGYALAPWCVVSSWKIRGTTGRALSFHHKSIKLPYTGTISKLKEVFCLWTYVDIKFRADSVNDVAHHDG